MANPPDNSWWTQSNPVPPVPAPQNPTLTTGGTLANPYKWPLPMNPLKTGSGPQPPPTPTTYPWGQ